MSMTTERRRPSARTALLAAGGLGLATALTFTAAQWSDQEIVEGTITTGEFDLVVTPLTLEFSDFVPEDEETSTHNVENASTVPAEVTLDIDGFSDAGVWNLTVTAGDGSPVFEGDPTTAESGLDLGELAPGADTDVVFTLVLTGDDEDSQGISDDLEFTFDAEQILEDDDDNGDDDDD